MKFTSLPLNKQILQILKEKNFVDCTPIQEQVFPLIVSGKDVAGLSQTGTGKTLAFVLPLVQRILNSKTQNQSNTLPFNTPEQKQNIFIKPWADSSYVLIITPTRELAFQAKEVIQSITHDTDISLAITVGGIEIEKDIEQLRSPIDFLIATPGRLIDLYKNHHLHLGQVQSLVLDEADKLFDMGFRDDIKYIVSRVPNHRQFLLFSATLNLEVMELAYRFNSDPIEVNLSRRDIPKDLIEEGLYHVGQKEKPCYLLSLLNKENWNNAIVFSNYKKQVLDLEFFLTKNGIQAMGLSSALSQSQRNKVIQNFKSEKESKVLIATDVAARGLDISGVDLIINYDIPSYFETYIHRIGRTGRAGKKGKAINLSSDYDVEALVNIEQSLKHKIPVLWLEKTEFVEDFKPYQKISDIKTPPMKNKKTSSSRRTENKSPSSFNRKKKTFKSKSKNPRKIIQKKITQKKYKKQPAPSLWSRFTSLLSTSSKKKTRHFRKKIS